MANDYLLAGDLTRHVVASLDALIRASLRQNGFNSTLKSLKKGRLPGAAPDVMTVSEGILQKETSGLYSAALTTGEGQRVVLQNAERTDGADPQFVPVETVRRGAPECGPITSDAVLAQLTAFGVNAPCNLICEVELTRFDAMQQQSVAPVLWEYILRHRNSNSRDRLVSVGAAIRKYVATMPMDEMGHLAVLLESGTKSPLPISLEIEVVKMIYRSYEVNPPANPDPEPQLAERLWEMVQAYINERILLRDRHSAVASLSIQAIVAMRSPLSPGALRKAIACPYRWFAQLVTDNLAELRERWSRKDEVASSWLWELQKSVIPPA